MTAGSLVAVALVVAGIGAGILRSRASSDAVPPSVPRHVVSVEAPFVVALDRLAAARAMPAPGHSGRVDIFSFAAAPLIQPMRIRPSVAATPGAPAALAPAEPESRLKLIGIAENHGEGGLLRTAILTDGADLWLVRSGQAVGSYHHVAEVSPDAATLRDVRTNSLLRLVLE